MAEGPGGRTKTQITNGTRMDSYILRGTLMMSSCQEKKEEMGWVGMGDIGEVHSQAFFEYLLP